MKFGYYSDDEIPKFDSVPGYRVNSHGYRCPEFSSFKDGGKNVVVLGCSHTFGEGLDESEIWINIVAKSTEKNTIKLHWWNLARPGGSADQMIRILYGTERKLFPKIIIACWPSISRRERLDAYPESLTSDNVLLKTETQKTDESNFLKNVFLLEKFAQQNKAKTFHCFAQEFFPLNKNLSVLRNYTISNCWPEWDSIEKRELFSEPNYARDGIHYGVEHHKVFANLFLKQFSPKLR